MSSSSIHQKGWVNPNTRQKYFWEGNWEDESTYHENNLPPSIKRFVSIIDLTALNAEALDKGWARITFNGNELNIETVNEDPFNITKILKLLPKKFLFPRYLFVNDRTIELDKDEDAIEGWNHRDSIRKRIAYFGLSKRDAKVYSLTTYHGTDARNIQNILEKGLLARKPEGRFDKGVYLTNDIEKAARYAVEGIAKEGQPAILEIMISGGHRVKKIYRDPLDREESIFEDLVDRYDEDLRYLERDIDEVFNGKYIHNKVIDLTTFGDPTSLRGKNIYKAIIDYARKNGLNVEDIKRRMFDRISPNSNYGPWIISEDGSVVLDESVYEEMHQQIYPKNLPATTIKAIWLTGIPENVEGERLEIKSKLLPQEAKEIREEVKALAQDVYFMKPEESKKMEAMIEDLEYYNRHHWFDNDIKTLNAYKDANDLEHFKNEFEGISQQMDDEWFDDAYGASTIFVKLTPQDALRYIKKEKGYS